MTSLDVKGASFASRQMGVRAQIQHLKAYANTKPLTNPVVTPTVGESRFRFVERGVSPYVEWLGQKENPSGKGWAVGAGYGGKILNILEAILSMSTNNQSQTQKSETKTITVTFGATKYILNGEPFDEPTLVYNGVAYLNIDSLIDAYLQNNKLVGDTISLLFADENGMIDIDAAAEALKESLRKNSKNGMLKLTLPLIGETEFTIGDIDKMREHIRSLDA